MSSLDGTIVATALPTIVDDVGGLSRVTWVVTAYTLAVVASMPLYGKLSDLYGAQTDAGSGHHDLPGRVDDVRGRADDEPAADLAVRPGSRRRRPRRAGHGDDRRHRPRAEAGPLARLPGRDLRRGQRARPGGRWPLRRSSQLALGLLHQPAVRPSGTGHRPRQPPPPSTLRRAPPRLRRRAAARGGAVVPRAPGDSRRRQLRMDLSHGPGPGGWDGGPGCVVRALRAPGGRACASARPTRQPRDAGLRGHQPHQRAAPVVRHLLRAAVPPRGARCEPDAFGLGSHAVDVRRGFRHARQRPGGRADRPLQALADRRGRDDAGRRRPPGHHRRQHAGRSRGDVRADARPRGRLRHAAVAPGRAELGRPRRAGDGHVDHAPLPPRSGTPSARPSSAGSSTMGSRRAAGRQPSRRLWPTSSSPRCRSRSSRPWSRYGCQPGRSASTWKCSLRLAREPVLVQTCKPRPRRTLLEDEWPPR